MAPPPRRPSAWEVSFPEEAAAELEALQISQTSGPQTSPNLKRKVDHSADAPQRVAKRSQRLAVAYYKAPRRYIIETAEYRAAGEEIDPRLHKPVRVLQNFCVFDPSNRNELVTLDAVETLEEPQRQYAAAGIVLLLDEDDEDYGQEDGVDELEDTDGDQVHLDIMALSAFDYLKGDAPIYLETKFAFYELRGPSTSYKPYFLAFFAPRRVARSVMMRAAAADPMEDYNNFWAWAKKKKLDEAMPYIREAHENGLHRSPLIQELLDKTPVEELGPLRRIRFAPRPHLPNTSFLGNPDLALLKPENQSATHVTPLIYELAKGYFEENIQVVGAPPIPPNKADMQIQKAKALRFLKESVSSLLSPKKAYPTATPQYRRYGHCSDEARIGDEVYKAQDFVLIRRGHDPAHEIPAPLLVNIPDDAVLADYFWFARIIYFKIDSQKVHIQWLYHGSQMILAEMAHPQELFLSMHCQDLAIEFIAQKISVVYALEPPRRPEQFFLRSVYTELDASFTSLDEQEMNRVVGNLPPDNCLPCSRSEQHNSNAESTFVEEDSRGIAGVSYQGHKYHVSEFFLYQNENDGPALIGHLERVQLERRGGTVILFRKVGRVAVDLKGLGTEIENNLYPERHLFLTEETSAIPIEQLIRPVQVFAWSFFKDVAEVKTWVDYSPYNYYCTYRLPSLTTEPPIQSWARRVEVLSSSHKVCEFRSCRSDLYRGEFREDEFQAEQQGQGYQCLDLFGGTGAFSLGAAEGSRGCLKPTHVVEITPSAARTAQQNSDAVTYCQDANVVLRYFIKSAARHDLEVPKQLFDNKTPLPPPIEPGKMRAIFAGLPCQSHSRLNMYRKADDQKSNLILTAASYVDFFRPDFFFLENVPGFLRYNLLAEQASRYRVEGGIEMGGLKLLLRALLDMKYQVRFFLLQAGNYGAPQSRIRFFLVAARHGLPLPDMPQPTHDFEVVNQLRIKFPFQREAVGTLRTTRGTMAHPSVSVEDAIGDLPPFDWKHPDPKNADAALRKVLKRRKDDGIPVFDCDREKAHCGYEDVFEYKHAPRTSYQREAREHPTENIQHFTRCFLPKTVERVITIPLKPGADFRSLPDHLGEWQFNSPLSAVGRNRYRGGLYGRLDNNGYFPTTVTNMHPTAKQSKVLHPDCLRMVTVRELARSQGFPDWFVFVSRNDNVVTLHRQIGNAVPWQVSRALGRELRTALFKKWKEKQLRRDE
ncbi:hypothetical protein DFH07DRAFT_822537 [Mycena maculata]|uniref:DNA (cytosine-5-)-methyltransferase n=1 Tax=Mycena maculata TaxID=230809 RepID=A0AAD7J2R2_9AGAR|nr:hypothetical protein DFH07DRAFT_822537 [Mycena maculata]